MCKCTLYEAISIQYQSKNRGQKVKSHYQVLSLSIHIQKSQTSSRCWKRGQASGSVAAVDCSSRSEASGAKATRGATSSSWFSSLFLLTRLLSSRSSGRLTVWKDRHLKVLCRPTNKHTHTKKKQILH